MCCDQIEQIHKDSDFREAALRSEINGLKALLAQTEEENACLRRELDFRYSHDELEMVCGGELALNIRNRANSRREQILSGAYQIVNKPLDIHVLVSTLRMQVEAADWVAKQASDAIQSAIVRSRQETAKDLIQYILDQGQIDIGTGLHDTRLVYEIDDTDIAELRQRYGVLVATPEGLEA